jgi:hypothetical protein
MTESSTKEFAMRADCYLRAVLTVIAAALVYLCIALTPLPVALAQGTRVPGARTPGEPTGPAEVVIVGARLASDAALPVQIVGRVNVTGDVRVINDVRVAGRVEALPVPQTSQRVVLVGWEDHGARESAGAFNQWDARQGRGLPVSSSKP